MNPPKTTTSSDSLFLQSLHNPLQLRTNLSSLPQSSNHRQSIAEEESKIESEIIRLITTNNTRILKPNSGQSVSIGDHYVCVSVQEDPGLDHRVWEWHGHVMSYDQENGCSMEYIYGNYFERLDSRMFSFYGDGDGDEIEEDYQGVRGIRGLLSGLSLGGGRVLCRNMNANF